MTPIRFSVKNGVTTFHYKASELMRFARRGFTHGDVGMTLVRRENKMITYKGFGTIEHPSTSICAMTMVHFEPFDGKMPTDEERLVPPKPFFTNENTRLVMLDLSEKKQ